MMINLKDLKEADGMIRGLVMKMAAAPFWYLAIYMFNQKFYKQDLAIKVVFCVCITAITTVSLDFMLQSLSDLAKKYNKPIQGFDEDLSSLLVTLFYTSTLSIIIFLVYSIKYFWGIITPFYWIIVFSLTPLPITLFIFIRAKRNMRKKNNQ